MQDRMRTKLWGWPRGTLGPFLSGVHLPSGSISAPWQALSALGKPSLPSVHRTEPPGKDNSKTSLSWVSSSSGIYIKRYLVPRNTVYVALVGSKDMDCEWWGAGGGLFTKRKSRPWLWHLPRLHLVSVPQTSFLSLSRTCFLPLVSEPFQMSPESLIGTHRRRTLLHWKRVSFPGCRGKQCRMKNF